MEEEAAVVYGDNQWQFVCEVISSINKIKTQTKKESERKKILIELLEKSEILGSIGVSGAVKLFRTVTTSNVRHNTTNVDTLARTLLEKEFELKESYLLSSESLPNTDTSSADGEKHQNAPSSIPTTSPAKEASNPIINTDPPPFLQSPTMRLTPPLSPPLKRSASWFAKHALEMVNKLEADNNKLEADNNSLWEEVAELKKKLLENKEKRHKNREEKGDLLKQLEDMKKMLAAEKEEKDRAYIKGKSDALQTVIEHAESQKKG